MFGIVDYLPVYILFFLGALFFSVSINKLLLRFSTNLGIRNEEEFIRWSTQAKPALGGISFYIIFLLSVAFVAILPADAVGTMNTELFGLFAASTMGFLIGLADDAYNTIPVLKFLGQVTCASILISTNNYIPITPDFALNYIFSLLWVIGIMNSINMLDNMDGITATISIAIIITVLIVIFGNSSFQDPYIIVLIGVSAGLFGFLLYNWHPSKMYMGDTGSQFLGVFLAGIACTYLWQFREPNAEYFQLKQFLVPLLAFILPITDTTTVFIRRLWRGQSPFVGGKDHTTHHLVYFGFSDRQVAWIFILISAISIILVWLIIPGFGSWTFSRSLVIIIYVIALFSTIQYVYNIGNRKKKQLEGDDAD